MYVYQCGDVGFQLGRATAGLSDLFDLLMHFFEVSLHFLETLRELYHLE